MLNSNQRIASESFRAESVVSPSEIFRIEYGVVSEEKLLDDIEVRRLSSACRSIEHEELLDMLRISCDDRTDGPLQLIKL